MFKLDPEVKVLFNEEKPEIKIFVDNSAKSEAMENFLPSEKTFGNVTIGVTIIPGNKRVDSKGNAIDDLFSGNGAVSSIQRIKMFASTLTYVVFVKEVVQFYNDDISYLHGLCSTLYQDIAKTIFKNAESMLFCTESGKSLGCPLGEWP